jgi:Spy/CpxP family protein refolding chaperone
MFTLTLLAAALLSGAATTDSVPPIPAGLKPLSAHEVVMQVRDQQAALGLTDQQVLDLDALHTQIRTEKHQYKHQAGKPMDMQHVPMISKTQAYEETMAVLTPEQRERCQKLFAAPAQPKAKHKIIVPHGKP